MATGEPPPELPERLAHPTAGPGRHAPREDRRVRGAGRLRPGLRPAAGRGRGLRTDVVQRAGTGGRNRLRIRRVPAPQGQGGGARGEAGSGARSRHGTGAGTGSWIGTRDGTDTGTGIETRDRTETRTGLGTGGRAGVLTGVCTDARIGGWTGSRTGTRHNTRFGTRSHTGTGLRTEVHAPAGRGSGQNHPLERRCPAGGMEPAGQDVAAQVEKRRGTEARGPILGDGRRRQGRRPRGRSEADTRRSGPVGKGGYPVNREQADRIDQAGEGATGRKAWTSGEPVTTPCRDRPDRQPASSQRVILRSGPDLSEKTNLR